MKEAQYKPAKKLAMAIIVASVLLLVTFIGRAGVNVMGMEFVTKLQKQAATSADGEKIDTVERGVIRVNQVALGVLAILFIIWMRRLRRNLDVLDVKDVKSSSAACIYGWLIPLVCFVYPILVLQEIWKASDPDLFGKQWKKAPVSKLMILWWLFWVGFCFMGACANIIGRAIMAGKLPDVEALRSFYFLSFVDQLIGIPTAVLAVYVVINLTNRQEAKHENLRLQAEEHAAEAKSDEDEESDPGEGSDADEESDAGWGSDAVEESDAGGGSDADERADADDETGADDRERKCSRRTEFIDGEEDSAR